MGIKSFNVNEDTYNKFRDTVGRGRMSEILEAYMNRIIKKKNTVSYDNSPIRTYENSRLYFPEWTANKKERMEYFDSLKPAEQSGFIEKMNSWVVEMDDVYTKLTEVITSPSKRPITEEEYKRIQEHANSYKCPEEVSELRMRLKLYGKVVKE